MFYRLLIHVTQFWPPAPTFTEKDVNSQAGLVFIVTGGNQGVGLELIKMLYPSGAMIYMASRSRSRAEEAITTPRLKFLHLDVDDLNIVRSAAKTFSEQESRLEILWNNASVGAVPVGSKTKQGIEAHMGINNSVRIVWSSSWLMEARSPKGGYKLKGIEKGGTNDAHVNYATSKAVNWILADETAKRAMARMASSALMMFFVRNLILHPPKLRGYTELYAGLSPEITEKIPGASIIPWERIQTRNPRKDIHQAIENGKGREL
ncbi:hypothetical protein BGW36DRAFT_394529 [Talaromyces proteolyticus]|uniref:NAD(P)-binding protein n=1 Tax=Talaromyces proteolyticus TaxID=1131652 RepID=A0AAD4KY63_9EURO|nr:uncharacterized protein BGW36DRAFT_394529 [Talaromyces proteolyticus]KAH8701702.1 hypothetical protein BGW36DRAFT_394529 [Talaromyces proteolyticus]